MLARLRLALPLLLSGCSLIVPASGDFTYGDPDAGLDGDVASPDAGCPDMCDGVCTDTRTDPLHCGTCTRSCSAPTNGTAACDNSVCGFDCDSGYARVVGMCVERVAPRPIAPLSTSTVTSRRPTLRWELALRADGARIEICEDPACATVIQVIDAPGTSARPASDLPTGVVFWRLFSLLEGEAGVVPSPTWQMHVGARSADGDVDTSWGTILDLNNDGFADVAVGASYADENVGRVFIYLGGPGGLPATPSATLFGPTAVPGAHFGSLVKSAGDVNGDGYAHLLVGGVSTAIGNARVYLGGTGVGGLADAPPIDLPGGGTIADSAGDIDRDGYADLVLKVPMGRVEVHRGGPDGVDSAAWSTFVGTEDTSFGGSIAGVGDLDADGYADFAFSEWGANADVGLVHVFLGGPTPVSSEPALTLENPEVGGMYFGLRAFAVGDIDGDGHADLVVGSFRSAVGFTMYAYRRWPDGFDAGAASAITGAPGDAGQLRATGDVDGDGYDDVFVSSGGSQIGYVYRGGAGGLGASAAVTLTTPEGDVGYGYGRGAGDIDANGYADVIVGAPRAFDEDGRVYVFLASPLGVPASPSHTLVPDIAGSQFGGG